MQSRRKQALVAFALAGLVSAPALADDMFLKFVDAPADSNDPQHPDEIALLSFGFGVEAESSWTKGGGASVGKPQPGELHFSALMNRSVTPIFKHITNGTASPSAVLTVRTGLPGNRIGLEYVKYSFTGIFFTSVEQGLTGAGRALSRIAGVFKTVQIEQFGHDGRRVGCVAWDVPAGTVNDC